MANVLPRTRRHLPRPEAGGHEAEHRSHGHLPMEILLSQPAPAYSSPLDYEFATHSWYFWFLQVK